MVHLVQMYQLAKLKGLEVISITDGRCVTKVKIPRNNFITVAGTFWASVVQMVQNRGSWNPVWHTFSALNKMMNLQDLFESNKET